ncbi:MAG: glycosyltransferase family 4 protein [Anaerolineae bacterium]|nr:glycosyltransferase family 4 protein [Anaerolineae bacterium]
MAFHLGVDARLMHYRRGMGTVVHSLVQAWAQRLAAQPSNLRMTLYVDSTTGSQAAAAFAQPAIKIVRLGPRFYPLWEQLALPRQALRDAVDVLYCPANTGPIRLSPRVKLALTIHDVMYMLPIGTQPGQLPASPSRYQQLGRLYRRWVVPRAAHRANLITTDSQFSRNDIAQHLGQWLRQPSDEIQVVPLAAAAEYAPQSADAVNEVLRRLQVKPPYALGLGAIDPRKNTALLIEALEQLQPSDLTLVITGLDPSAQAHFAALVAQRGLRLGQQIQLLGFVSERDLAALYTAAEMLLYPSRYEGFGLPVLEAMQCGTPVITANTTSLPEIAEGAALLINPNDVSALCTAIQQLHHDASLRQRLRTAGLARAAQFNWQSSAKLMLTLLSKTAST